jgi:hypothetical protein
MPDRVHQALRYPMPEELNITKSKPASVPTEYMNIKTWLLGVVATGE